MQGFYLLFTLILCLGGVIAKNPCPPNKSPVFKVTLPSSHSCDEPTFYFVGFTNCEAFGSDERLAYEKCSVCMECREDIKPNVFPGDVNLAKWDSFKLDKTPRKLQLIFPTESPTAYPTDFPTAAPTFTPTTAAPVPPTTPQPSPLIIQPTASPTITTIFLPFSEEILVGLVCAIGGSMSMAGFVLIYYSRKRNVQPSVAEELLGWKEEQMQNSREQAQNPMYSTAKPTTSGLPVQGPNRESLKGINVHAWHQGVREAALQKETEQQSISHGNDVESGNASNSSLKMMMKYDFEAENDDELSARKGEVLLCLDMQGDWFVASNPETGRTGIVPRTYVQPIAEW